MIGVYKITNLINGKSYIGQSINIENRWISHRRTYLKKDNPEFEKTLYRAFRKHGIDNFSFEVLVECEPQELENLEKFYIQESNSYHKGYNETIGGDIGSFDRKGEKHPNAKLSLEDVIDIRTRYQNRERKKEVFRDYENKIQKKGFHNVWTGQTWKHIMMEVYSLENVYFHSHNTGNQGSQSSSSILTEEDVVNIRTRRKEGETRSQIYPDYSTKLTFGSFSCVYYGSNWKHVKI